MCDREKKCAHPCIRQEWNAPSVGEFAYLVYRANGFAVFRAALITIGSLVRVSIGAYERKPAFSLPFGKYWSNLDYTQ